MLNYRSASAHMPRTPSALVLAKPARKAFPDFTIIVSSYSLDSFFSRSISSLSCWISCSNCFTVGRYSWYFDAKICLLSLSRLYFTMVLFFSVHKINEQKAFENVIVEHQVDIEVIVIRCDPVLPTNKREPVF